MNMIALISYNLSYLTASHFPLIWSFVRVIVKKSEIFVSFAKDTSLTCRYALSIDFLEILVLIMRFLIEFEFVCYSLQHELIFS